MKKKFFSALQQSLLLVALVLSIGGCQLHEHKTDFPDNPQDFPIRFQSGLSPRMQAATPGDQAGLQGVKIMKNEPVYTWIFDAGKDGLQENPQALYQANRLISDGNGHFDYENPMYFPQSRNGINIYALHGNFDPAINSQDEFPELPLPYSVNERQIEAWEIAASDLLYAVEKNVLRTRETIPVTFYHLLSKIEIAFHTKDENLELAENDAVQIRNVVLSGLVHAQKPVDLQDPLSRAGLLKDDPSNPTPTSIITDQVITTIDHWNNGHKQYNEAIIIPQTLSGGTEFITVKLKGGRSLSYLLPAPKKFESGKKYRFDIELDPTGLHVSSSIEDWRDAASIEGETGPLPIGTKIDPQRAVPGDFYMADGTFVGKDDTLSPLQKASCIGIVFYTGSQAADQDPILSSPGNYPDCNNGLVVALHDFSDMTPWGSLTENLNPHIASGWLSQNAALFPGVDLMVRDLFCGYSNTKVLEAFYREQTASTSGSEPLIFQALETFRTENPTPKICSGWYIPSFAELQFLCCRQTGIVSGTQGCDFLEDFLRLAEGSPLPSVTQKSYWTSTECDLNIDNGRSAKSLDLSSGTETNSFKHKPLAVRPILAF